MTTLRRPLMSELLNNRRALSAAVLLVGAGVGIVGLTGCGGDSGSGSSPDQAAGTYSAEQVAALVDAKYPGNGSDVASLTPFVCDSPLNNVGDISICKAQLTITLSGQSPLVQTAEEDVTLADHNGHVTYQHVCC